MAIGPSVVAPVLFDGMSPGTPVLVLRHGQSEWNAIRRWQGSADSPLSEVGRAQATSAASRLRSLGVRFTGPWTSDLSRAAETATIVAAELGLGAPIRDPRLREAHAGEWEGLTPHEIEDRYPGWLDAHRRPPSFEARAAVLDRALRALSDIAASTGGEATPLVVAHSGLIRTVVRHAGGTETRIPNLGGVWLRVGIDRPGGSGAVGSATVADPDPAAAVVHVDDLFDADAVVPGVVDGPWEDPGDEPDDADAHRPAEG